MAERLHTLRTWCRTLLVTDIVSLSLSFPHSLSLSLSLVSRTLLVTDIVQSIPTRIPEVAGSVGAGAGGYVCV